MTLSSDLMPDFDLQNKFTKLKNLLTVFHFIINIKFILLHRFCCLRDEHAPRKIEDANAVMPDDWLEEEEPLIPDSDATKPSDWDDSMDGEWEAPKIDNPKCKDRSGCGKWTRPMIDNPNYKVSIEFR